MYQVSYTSYGTQPYETVSGTHYGSSTDHHYFKTMEGVLGCLEAIVSTMPYKVELLHVNHYDAKFEDRWYADPNYSKYDPRYDNHGLSVSIEKIKFDDDFFTL